MKHIISIAVLSFAATLAAPAMAAEGSGCHFHGYKPAAEATVIDCASKLKMQLVQSGKLSASWQTVRHEKIEAVEGKKGKEWRVTFKNPAEQDKTKETLYMFYALTGNYIAANFSGK